MHNGNPPILVLTGLLTLPLIWGCDANDSATATAPETIALDAPQPPPMALVSGLYQSELITNLLPLSTDLDNGLRSEGTGEIAVRQLLWVDSQGGRELSANGCREAPASVEIDASLHALEQIAPEANCGAVEVVEQGTESLSLRRQCEDGGYAQLRLQKLQETEVASVMQLQLSSDEEYFDAAKCFEMSSFAGTHHLYRNGLLLESQAVHTHHMTVAVASNAGDLLTEWAIEGPLAVGRYRWSETPITGEPVFNFQLSGEHPWAGTQFTGGTLEVEQLSPTLRLSFTVERADAAPLQGRLQAPAEFAPLP